MEKPLHVNVRLTMPLPGGIMAEVQAGVKAESLPIVIVGLRAMMAHLAQPPAEEEKREPAEIKQPNSEEVVSE
jgi:hypothetical protein